MGDHVHATKVHLCNCNTVPYGKASSLHNYINWKAEFGLNQASRFVTHQELFSLCVFFSGSLNFRCRVVVFRIWCLHWSHAFPATASYTFRCLLVYDCAADTSLIYTPATSAVYIIRVCKAIGHPLPPAQTYLNLRVIFGVYILRVGNARRRSHHLIIMIRGWLSNRNSTRCRAEQGGGGQWLGQDDRNLRANS